MADNSDMLDASEAADYLKINVQTVRRLARDKVIPAFRVGGTWRFRRTRLDAWAEDQQSGGHAAKHVVAVDDEDMALSFIQRALADEDCTLAIATNGPDALDLMEGTAPDLVILDLMMPEMDGPTLLGHIREKHGAVPVIVFTGYPDGEAMQRAMEYSPVMFLSKPPRLKQFLDAVRSVIGSPTEA